MLEEMFLDQFGNLELVINIIENAVVSHVSNLLRFQLHIFERILEIVQVHKSN